MSHRGITDCFSSLMHPWHPVRGPQMRVNHATTILAILLMCLPSAVATSSEISFLGVTSYPEADGSRAIAIDPSNEYLAVGYNDHATIMWLENETLILSIDLSRPVETMKFSNDGDFLAIALSGSETQNDAIQLYDMSPGYIARSNVSEGKDSNACSTRFLLSFHHHHQREREKSVNKE